MTDEGRLVQPGEELVLVRGATEMESLQGHHILQGICAETAGAKGLCLNLIHIPPGGRALAHVHPHHESAVYMIEGEAIAWYGLEMQYSLRMVAGDFVYIPAGVPHLPVNASQTTPVTALVARTDPYEHEAMTLLPALDERVRAQEHAGLAQEVR